MHRPLPPRRAPLLGLLAGLVVVGASSGCEQPNPLLPAEPIGEVPKWGQDFAQEPKAAGDSLLGDGSAGGPEGPVPTGPSDVEQKGGSAVPGANPMAKEKWGGGSAANGKSVFLTHCAMCHGPDGRGGQKMGMNVPTLRDPGWHNRVDDNHIASTVAHGKGAMPSFMGKLDKTQMNDLVAFVRSLKRAPAEAPKPAAPEGDAPPE